MGDHGNVIEITDDADFVAKVTEAKNQGAKVAVDFSATWCGPCKMIAPTYVALSKKFPEIKFWKVDEKACKNVCQSLGIRAYPTFHFYCGDVLVLQFSGADKAKLEANVTKLQTLTKDELLKISEEGEQKEAKDSFVEGDLKPFLDEKRTECLNDASNCPFKNMLADDDTVTKSDCDEQLLITLTYTTVVAIKSIKFTGPSNGPKTVKLFVNKANLGFEEAQEDTPIQILQLSPEDLKDDGPVTKLDVIKFNKISTLTVFVEDNQTGEEQTAIKKLSVFGSKAK